MAPYVQRGKAKGNFMAVITLQILDGADRGHIHRDLHTPVTVGREEGNTVQLNDERVSRFHVKIQEDQGQLVLTDLDSTNGTRVNGEPVQLSILRVGDRIAIGRTLLVVGSPEEIDRQLADSGMTPLADDWHGAEQQGAFDRTRPLRDERQAGGSGAEELRFEVDLEQRGTSVSPLNRPAESGPRRPPPELPRNLTPAQAAQFAEILLYLHRRLAHAIELVTGQDAEGGAHLPAAAWQRILRVEMELASYMHRIAEPEK